MSLKAARYAHAKQFKRMRRVIKLQRTVLASLGSEIERKARVMSAAVRNTLAEVLTKAWR